MVREVTQKSDKWTQTCTLNYLSAAKLSDLIISIQILYSYFYVHVNTGAHFLAQNMAV